MKSFSFFLLLFEAIYLSAFRQGAVQASNAKRDIIQVSNSQAQFFPEYRGPDAHGSGIVCAGNDANFDAAHLNEALSEYVVRIQDTDGIEAEINRIAPPVTTGRHFNYHVADKAEDFQIDAIADDDIREIGGDFKELRPKGTLVESRTQNKGLIVKIDHDAGGAEQAVREAWTTNLKSRLLRSDLYRVNSIIDTNATTGTNATVNWGASGTPWDPDGNMAQLLKDSGDERGINSNTLLMSGTAWLRRFLALAFATNPALTATRTMSPEALAAILQVEDILISNRRYQSGAVNATNANTKKMVMDAAATGTIYALFRRGGVNQFDPSNIKRFVSSCQGGGTMRVYLDEKMKYTIIGVEHYSRVVCTSTIGLKKLPVTFT